MFGFQIYLNFNKDGDSHKTLIGGIVSMLIQSFMILYVVIRFRILILNLADMNFTEIGVVDLDNNPDYQDLEFKNMKMALVHSIRF